MRIRFYNRDLNTNSLADATSVVLADENNAYGIINTGNNEIIVPAGVAMTRFDNGTYEYVFTPSAFSNYRYAITWVYQDVIRYLENVILSTNGDIGFLSYISTNEADNYFSQRLHSGAWTDSSSEDKIKSLITATKIIDRLRFKGTKLNLDEVLEFPRIPNSQFPCRTNSIITIIPQAIKDACAEIAIALLDDIDPDAEYRNLRVIARRYSSVGTTYDTRTMPIHLVAGIPSLTAWNLLQPYLEELGGIKIHRVS